MSTKRIPFFNYKFFYENYRDEILAITDDILKRGAFILQQDTRDFEQHIADYLGVKYALSVANCTDGLEIALKATGITSGDEVIFPSHTFVATASAIHSNGAVPVPVECKKDHLIDPQAIEMAITDNTKAIIPVQLNGRTCDMDTIQRIADKHQLLIIEDAAQGLGSAFKNKKAGSFGLAAAISFYPAKILGCLGDGGIVLTDDDSVADRVYEIRDHGRSREGHMVGWGRNSRLDNLQAAILNRLFQDYDRVITRRRTIAAIYQEHLSHIDDLVLPPAPDSDPNHFDVYQNYEIESSYRDALEKHLNENGIGTLRQWGGITVHQMSALGLTKKLPFTEQMIARSLLLPMNLSITNEEIHYVCHKIEYFYENLIHFQPKNKNLSIENI